MYYPGMITQTILTAIIIGLLSFGGYYYVMYHMEVYTTAQLEKAIKDCEVERSSALDSNKFLKENMAALKSYYIKQQRTKPPVIIDGHLKLENLFQGTPR